MTNTISLVSLATNAGKATQAIYSAGILPENLKPIFDFMQKLIDTSIDDTSREANSKAVDLLRVPCNHKVLLLDQSSRRKKEGQHLKALREKKGFSAKELCDEMLQIKKATNGELEIPSENWVYAVESGRIGLKQKYVPILAQALAVSPEEIKSWINNQSSLDL